MAEQVQTLRKKINPGLLENNVRLLEDVNLDDLTEGVLFGANEVIKRRFEAKGNVYMDTLKWKTTYDFKEHKQIVNKNETVATNYLVNHRNGNVFSVMVIHWEYGRKGRATFWDEEEKILKEAGK